MTIEIVGKRNLIQIQRKLHRYRRNNTGHRGFDIRGYQIPMELPQGPSATHYRTIPRRGLYLVRKEDTPRAHNSMGGRQQPDNVERVSKRL